MAKPFSIPDPNDRSVNDPSIIVDSNKVLGLYNQEHDSSMQKERVVDSVKEWYTERMKREGWNSVEFHGNQCVLEAKVKLEE